MIFTVQRAHSQYVAVQFSVVHLGPNKYVSYFRVIQNQSMSVTDGCVQSHHPLMTLLNIYIGREIKKQNHIGILTLPFEECINYMHICAYDS